MRDTDKTKEQLIDELAELRLRFVELQALQAERRRAEESLRESEERFRWVAEKNFDLIYELDLEGRITFLSSAAAELSGGNPERILGQYFQEFLPEWEQKKGIEALTDVKMGKSIYGLQMEIFRFDGSIGWFEFNFSPKFKGQEVIGVRGVCKDVTERKLAEEKERELETLKEIDRLRTELLANVSHELRTPLASIKGYTTMLLNYEGKLHREARQEHLRAIDSASDKLMELIDQLLDMSRMEAGLFELRKVPTRVSQLIEEARTESIIRAPNHRITLDAPRRLPLAYIDPKRVRQVLDNLVDNATKYSSPGTEVVIRVRRNKDDLVFSVSDQGSGIPEEHLARVFDRMYRVQQEERTDHINGIGLGLSICKGLIEAHGGHIWIESKVGQGTTCFFTVPLKAGPDGANHCFLQHNSRKRTRNLVKG